MADRGYEQKHAADDADDVTLDLPIRGVGEGLGVV